MFAGLDMGLDMGRKENSTGGMALSAMPFSPLLLLLKLLLSSSSLLLLVPSAAKSA